MKISWIKGNPYGVLFVIKTPYICLIIIVWNVLCGIGVYLNDGFGKITRPSSLAMVSLAALYSMYCAYAPLISEKIRTRWCEEGKDFEKAKYGLEQMGLGSAALLLISLFSIIAML
jgi:hypothetical protein